MNSMVDIVKQCKWEYNLWLDTIGQLKNENIHLNNRLAELASEKLPKKLRSVIEVLADSILEHDKLLAKKWNELQRFGKEYAVDRTNTEAYNLMLSRHSEIRKKIEAIVLRMHTFRTFFCTEINASISSED
ncbi:MAG: hypothetical protein JST82_12330 [Bacteroidetes bacterium]|nr:hypothetical protein [Bacteroidota bacterium]